MGTVSESSSDVLPSPFTMGTTFVSSSNAHPPSVTTETQTLSSDDGIHPSFQFSEDEDWWEGVEEVDLTLPFEEPLEDNFEEGFETFTNETNFWDMECEVFLQMTPPPKWIDLPPPPLPPILRDKEPLLREFGRNSYNNEQGLKDFEEPNVAEGAYAPPLEEEEKCSLCGWAEGGNQTLNLFDKRQSESSAGISNGMIGALIGVAFVSAAIGAAVMSFLLKCRRGGTLVPCGRDPCPILVGRRNWPKPSSAVQNQPEPPTSPPESTKSEPPSGMGWAMKRWRRSSSQAPLHLSSSPGSENSYVEDQYVNCDANSAVYAEMDSVGSFVLAEPSLVTPVSNACSEIPSNFARPSELSVCPKVCTGQPKCDNGGYMLSETPPEPNDSSVGSTSTPSSAYYSDVSSCEIAPNSKMKMRARDDERLSNVKAPEKPFSISAISNHVEFQPVQLNLNPVQPQRLPPSESVPMTLQLLPKQLNVDLHRVQNVSTVSGSLPHQNIIRSLQPPARYMLNHNETNDLAFSESQKLFPCGHYDGLYPDEAVRHSNGIHIQRPLPPLPSRRINGPKRKQVKAPIDQGISSIPSKYV